MVNFPPVVPGRVARDRKLAKGYSQANLMAIAIIIGAVGVAFGLFLSLFGGEELASNAEIESVYGFVVIDNANFDGDEFLRVNSEAVDGTSLAEVCKRPTKSNVENAPELDCYIP